MSMYWFLEVQSGWEWLADALVILWIGAGMTTIAWMKMWMAKPTFNTGGFSLDRPMYFYDADYAYSMQYDLYHSLHRVSLRPRML